MKIPFKKLSEDAVIPQVAHTGDAGFDLCTTTDVTLAQGERAQIPTGLAFAIPDGYVGLIWDKSGLSHKAGIKTLGGVVDAGYRGEVFVGVINLSSEPYTFRVGEKVAQMLIQKVERPVFEVVTELDTTERQDGGFGSTGK